MKVLLFLLMAMFAFVVGASADETTDKEASFNVEWLTDVPDCHIDINTATADLVQYRVCTPAHRDGIVLIVIKSAIKNADSCKCRQAKGGDGLITREYKISNKPASYKQLGYSMAY